MQASALTAIIEESLDGSGLDEVNLRIAELTDSIRIASDNGCNAKLISELREELAEWQADRNSILEDAAKWVAAQQRRLWYG